MEIVKFFFFCFLIFSHLQSSGGNFERLPLELMTNIFESCDVKIILHSTRKVSTHFYHAQHQLLIKKLSDKDNTLFFKWIEHVVQELNENRYAKKKDFCEINNGAFFKVLTQHFVVQYGFFSTDYFQSTDLHEKFNEKFDMENIKCHDKKFDLLSLLPNICKVHFGIEWFAQDNFKTDNNKRKNELIAYFDRQNCRAKQFISFLQRISHCIDEDYYEKYEQSLVDMVLQARIPDDSLYNFFQEYCLSQCVNHMEVKYRELSVEKFNAYFVYNVFWQYIYWRELSFHSAQSLIKIIDFLYQKK